MQNPSSGLQISQPRLVLRESRPPPPLLPLPLTKSTASSPAGMGGRRPVNAKNGKFLSSGMQQQMISAADGGVGEEAEAHSIFLASPHPSSLPLPKFSVQRSCRVVESLDGIDARATDNLRRLLRLR